MCELTQCQSIKPNPSSSIIRTSIKEHLRPIKKPNRELISDRNPRPLITENFPTNQIPSDPYSTMCSQRSHGEASETILWVQLLGHYEFQFSPVDFNWFWDLSSPTSHHFHRKLANHPTIPRSTKWFSGLFTQALPTSPNYSAGLQSSRAMAAMAPEASAEARRPGLGSPALQVCSPQGEISDISNEWMKMM